MKLVIQVFIDVHISPRQEAERQPPPAPRQETPTVNPLQPVCPACGWTNVYSNLESARKALAAHRQHCAGKWSSVSPFSVPVWTKKP